MAITVVCCINFLQHNTAKSEELLSLLLYFSICTIPLLTVISLLSYAISRLWAEPYATMTDDYIILEEDKIFYKDIKQIVLVPGTWTPGFKSMPYGPAEIYVYYNNQDYTIADGISYYFCLQLKKRCPQATFRCKYLLHIFLLTPLLTILGSTILTILFYFFPEQ